jgi:hypothetical protein
MRHKVMEERQKTNMNHQKWGHYGEEAPPHANAHFLHFWRRFSTSFPRPPLIDMVVSVFSVGRRPATPETYQSASGRPTRGEFTLLEKIYVEIFGGRKFRENFEAQNPHPEIFPQFSNFRSDHRKFGENFESLS